MNRRVLFLMVLFLMVFIPPSVWAWGFHDAMENGTSVNALTPQHCAMNGASALPSSGVVSLFLNPAELSLLKSPVLSANFSAVKWDSEVGGPYSIPVFDSGNSGSFSIAAGMPVTNKLYLAAGMAKISEYGYNKGLSILEEQDGVYNIYALQMLNSQGSLYEANAGASLAFSDEFQAGVSIGVRFGKGSFTLRYEPVDIYAPGDTTFVEWDTADPCIHLGLLIPLSWGTFAVSGSNPTDRYQSRVAFGFEKVFELLNGSTLGFDYGIQSIEDSPEISGRLYANLNELIPSVRNIYSIGFQQPHRYHHTALTFGTGAVIDLGDLDVSLGISWRSRSRSGLAFPEPYIIKIDDSGTYFSAGIAWRP